MVESSSTLESSRKQGKIEDYALMKKIGNGAFGKVYLAKHIKTNEIFAIKQLDKQTLIKLNKQEAVMREKVILKLLQGIPNIIKLD